MKLSARIAASPLAGALSQPMGQTVEIVTARHQHPRQRAVQSVAQSLPAERWKQTGTCRKHNFIDEIWGELGL